MNEPLDPLDPPNRPLNASLGMIVALTVIAALLIVIIVRAYQISRQNAAGALIRVPADYATIQAAIDAADPGDVIQVSVGVYAENLILNKPVSLVAEVYDQINPVNNQTIIDGRGGAAVILIPLDLTQMPVVRGFVIQNGVDGIQASSAFIAESNYLHTATNLISYQKGGGGFNRSNVYFNASDNAIRLDNVDRPILIENNRIMYSGDDGIEISLQNTTIPPGLIQIDIWNNMILGNREDGIQFVDHAGDPQDTNRRFVIAGNLIANSKKAGIGLMPNANTLEDYSGADTVEAVRVFNNTFYGNDFGISGGDNLIAFNNIIANSLNIGSWKVQGPVGANSVVAYTLFHNSRLDADQTTIGPGIITGQDPLFVAAPNPGPDGAWETVDDDFSGLVLQSGSPAIDKGVIQFVASNGEPVPPNPITGFTGAAPDLGWREFGAPIFSTPTATPVNSSTPAPTGTFLPTLTPAPSLTSTIVVSATLPALTATPVTVTAAPTNTAIVVPPTVAAASPTATIAATVAAPVAVQSVTPNTAVANTTVVLTVTGSGFQPGAGVSFEGGQGLPQEVVAVQVINPTTLMVTVNAKNDGALGQQVWDIRVTNPDSSSAILADAFTVAPVP